MPVAGVVAPESMPRNWQERRALAAAARRYADVRTVAAHVGISVPSVWRGVAQGRLPQPSYPTPGAPRWDLAEVDAAMTALRALPRDNLTKRRTARRAARQAATDTTTPLEGSGTDGGAQSAAGERMVGR